MLETCRDAYIRKVSASALELIQSNDKTVQQSVFIFNETLTQGLAVSAPWGVHLQQHIVLVVNHNLIEALALHNL